MRGLSRAFMLHSLFWSAEFVHRGVMSIIRKANTLSCGSPVFVPSAVTASVAMRNLWAWGRVVPFGLLGREDGSLFPQCSGSQDHNVARADAVCLRNY